VNAAAVDVIVLVKPVPTAEEKVPPSATYATEVPVNTYRESTPESCTVASWYVLDVEVAANTASPTLRAAAVADLSVIAIAEAEFIVATRTFSGVLLIANAAAFASPTGASATAEGVEIVDNVVANIAASTTEIILGLRVLTIITLLSLVVDN
jgi:hypothetical protein